jgi:hypothetical protein
MNLKGFKLFCVIVGMMASIFLAGSSLMAEESRQRHMGLHEWLQTLPEDHQQRVICILEHTMELKAGRAHAPKKGEELADSMYYDLESFLTPEQLQGFRDIFTRKNKLSTASATCGDCYWPNYYTFKALSYIEQAIASYNSSSHQCDEPVPNPWGMPPWYYAITPMQMARSSLINAESQSWNAYLNCACHHATNAKYNLLRAKVYIDYAIDDSLNHCDPNPPWMSQLYSAKSRVNDALNGIQDCVDQACN